MGSPTLNINISSLRKHNRPKELDFHSVPKTLAKAETGRESGAVSVPAVYLASVLVMPIQSVTKEQDIKRTTFPNYMHKRPPVAEYWPGNRSVGTGSH